MNIVKVGVAVLVGFLLGAVVYKPVSAKASGFGVIYVKRVAEGMNPDPITVNREVIGFSCTSGATGAECYLAVR